MKLSLAVLAAVLPAIAAKKARKKALKDMDLSNVQIGAATKTGGDLLSKARRLDGNDETTWIAGYSLRFNACTSSTDYYGGYFNGEDNDGQNYNYNNYNNGNGNNNNNYNNNGNGNNGDNYNGDYYGNNNRQDYSGMYQQRLVHFSLCPSDSCWRCTNGAEYVVTLGDFVDAALEAKMTAAEYNCERVRENCYCDNANSEETCLYNCYKNAQLTECAEAMYEDEFDIQEAVECVQLEVEDEDAVKNYIYSNTDQEFWNGVYWAQQGGGDGNGEEVGEIEGDIYIGPYCSKNGKKVHLGVFMEETCSYPAPAGIYEALHYGAELPYAKKSIVDSKCISCVEPKEVDYENYWDQQDADNVAEMCTNVYEMAGKCEEKLDGYYPNRDVSGCQFISTLKSTHGFSVGSANMPAKVMAGIFAASTALLAGAAMVLFRRDRRRNVNLAGEPILA